MARTEARPEGRRVYLDTPVTYLKNVGPRRAELLRRLGIVTAGDFLHHIPHRYEDASTVASRGWTARSSDASSPRA
jgi:ATP-dependent DNA helicase RecG